MLLEPGEFPGETAHVRVIEKHLQKGVPQLGFARVDLLRGPFGDSTLSDRTTIALILSRSTMGMTN